MQIQWFSKNTQLIIRVLANSWIKIAILLSVSLPFYINASTNEINLAVSNATTGPVSQLGLRLNQGANAYFNKVNLSGGINGKKVNIIQLDDGYEPYKTYQNTQVFLSRDDIFAFFNYVGTPTSYAIFNKISSSELPFITPFTGAEFLRTPVTDNIYNLRASYYQEVDKQIEYLVNKRKIKRIGLLVQADEFGISVEKGYLIALKKRGIEPVVTTRYRRNSLNIKLALSVLEKKNVEAIAFVGTYQPFAELINLAFVGGYKPVFTTVSFISSQDLFPLIKQSSDVLVTEVLEDPMTCIKDICQQFIDDMNDLGLTDLDRVQFEGYLNALVFSEAAKQCSLQLTRRCLLAQLSKFEYHKKGLDISFRGNTHQGLSEVFLNFYSSSK